MCVDAQISEVERKIARYEKELDNLRSRLQELRIQHEQTQHGQTQHEHSSKEPDINLQSRDRPSSESRFPLALQEFKRYGRQLILPEIGLQGQLNLKRSSVLIVGAGGLGCPAAAYLAGAGVGHIGVIDGDTVEESNLHRQILHSTSKVGMKKVASIIAYIHDLNPLVKTTGYEEHLSPEVAVGIFEKFDLVLDCTDNPASRYLISDTCVLTGKPLVSASALKTEGQLMVLNHPVAKADNPLGGPCYRCVFPKPPPVQAVVTCGEGGILGPVVGIMGVLQALEAIKIITKGERELDSEEETSSRSHSLLLFSAYSNPQFRSMRLRGRRKDCTACSPQSIVTAANLSSGSLDYVQFCGAATPVSAVTPEEQISVSSLHDRLREHSQSSSILLDTRDIVQFDLCHIEGSINIPFSKFPAVPKLDSLSSTTNSTARSSPAKIPAGVKVQVEALLADSMKIDTPPDMLHVLCRQGNDSQIVTRLLKDIQPAILQGTSIKNVQGGLVAWQQDVDSEFPIY